MVSEMFDRVVLVAIGLVTSLVVGLIVAVAVPLMFISETPDDLTGQEAAAARFALGQVESAGGPSERVIRLRSKVVHIEPDPSGCEWGYPGRIAAIVTVNTYTLLGVPLGEWTVDCHGPHKS